MKKIVLFYFLLTMPVAAGSSSVYIDQVGDYNSIYITQQDADSKEAILLNKGNNNQSVVIQEGSGAHQAFIGTPPVSGSTSTGFTTNTLYNNNNNILSILQSGAGNHTAAINLDPTTTNNNNTATITQAGNANKSFSLGLSGSGITANVLQDNLLTPDSGSMNITCLTPPCSGYSYIKR